MGTFDVIHLTDLHILPPGQRNYGLDPAERLAFAIASIAERHGPGSAAPAACAIVTGDLAHHGEPAAYAELGRLLDPLPMPVHLCLGNHDDRANFRAAFPAHPVDADGFVQQAIDTPAGRLLLLDPHEPGTPAGRLCAVRLGWLADRLAESDAPVLLWLHHPPFAVGIGHMDGIPLLDADAFWAVLAPHRARLRHLFHGHLHRPLAGSWRGLPCSSLRGTSHQVWLDFAPRDNVPGSHEPPAYAAVRVSGEDVVVHSHDFLDGSASFDL
jgi:3',5'-cyclic AMP phosphodiesterase CpdA